MQLMSQKSNEKCQMSDVDKVKPFVGEYLRSFSGHFLTGVQDYGVQDPARQQCLKIFTPATLEKQWVCFASGNAFLETSRETVKV